MFGIKTRFRDKDLNENDIYISYLPFSHVFEQGLNATSITYGMRCGFFGGNPLKLVEDMQLLKPTFFATVPRLLNRINDKIQ